MTKLVSPAVIFLSLLAFGCQQQLNDRPPGYIKNITVYKEGSALVAYFVLADSSGAMTTSDGKVRFRILAIYGPEERILYENEFKVRKEDFRKTKIGLGAFEREVILYPIGRIPYSEFKFNPGNVPGRARVIFEWGSSLLNYLDEQEKIFLEDTK